MHPHNAKTLAELLWGLALAFILWLVDHWIPAMQGLAATLVALTCWVRLNIAIEERRHRRAGVR